MRKGKRKNKIIKTDKTKKSDVIVVSTFIKNCAKYAEQRKMKRKQTNT